MDTDLTSFPEAPEPTARELRERTSLPRQFGRFIVLNLKMMGMVRKGPH